MKMNMKKKKNYNFNEVILIFYIINIIIVKGLNE